MTLLAQSTAAAPVSFAAFVALVMVGSLLIGICGTFLTLFITRREVEQRASEYERRLDALEADSAEMKDEIKADALAVRAEIRAVNAAIHESELRLAAAGEKRASDIHSRFNLLIEGLSELRGEVHASARSNSPR